MSQPNLDDTRPVPEYELEQYFPERSELSDEEREKLREQHGYFRTYFRERADRFRRLQRWLNQARFGVTYDVYLAATARYAIGGAILGVILGVGLGIQLDFEADTVYQLRMSKVAFESSNPEDPEPKYMVVEEPETSLRPEGETELSVTVRDRYSNPVSGVELIANISEGAGTAAIENSTLRNVDNVTLTTGEDGRARVPFTAGPGFTGAEVTFKSDFDGDGSRETVNPRTGGTAENATVAVSPAGSSPIRLTDATISSGNQVNLTVRNGGTVPRRATSIQLNYVTVEEQKKVVESADLATTTSDTLAQLASVVTDAQVNVGKTNATDTIDGPNAITALGVYDAGDEGTDLTLGSPAREGGEARNAFDTSFPALAPNEETTLRLTFDESIEADMQNAFGDSDTPGDALEVSVTVTYEGGRQETYTTVLHHPEDDDR